MHADGAATVAAALVDNTNGAYSLAFRLQLQGEWRLVPHVNGGDIPAGAVKVCARLLFHAAAPAGFSKCMMLCACVCDVLINYSCIEISGGT